MNKEHKISCVYLLVSADGKKFKIGRSKHIFSRYKTLKKDWGEFDLEKSLKIKCPANQAANLEKILQFVFDEWNLDLTPKTDGYTEWFNMECFGKARHMLESICQHKSDIQIFESVKIPEIKPAKKENIPVKLKKVNPEPENIRHARKIAKVLCILEDFLIAYHYDDEAEKTGVASFAYGENKDFVNKKINSLFHLGLFTFQDIGGWSLFSFSRGFSEYVSVTVHEVQVYYYLENTNRPECIAACKILDACLKRIKKVCKDQAPPPGFSWW